MFRDSGRHLFLVIEGVDGAGKTTIAKRISTVIGGKYIKSPPEPFAMIKQRVLETATPVARFTYFISSNVQISALAKRLLNETHVVSDRYIWSTLAYHAAIENISPIELKKMVMPLVRVIKMPDYVIFLTVSREAQLQRLKGRLDDELQRSLLMSDQFQRRLRQAYRSVKSFFDVKWIEIDTSRKSISGVIRTVEQIIS